MSVSNLKLSNHQIRMGLLGAVSALALVSASQSFAGSITLEAEGAYLGDHGDDVVFGGQYNIAPAAFSNDGVERDDDYAYRLAGQWNGDGPWSFRVGYGMASFDGSAGPFSGDYNYPQLASAPPIDTTFWIFNPCASICAQIYTSHSGEIDTELDFLDFDIGYDVGVGQGTARIFGGIRYATFDEEVRSTHSNTNYFLYYYQQFDVRRQSDFDGWGPRAGFTADIPLMGNLSVGGTFAVAAIFGEVETSISGVHTTAFILGGAPATTNTVSISSTSSDETSYTIELAPALKYSFNGNGMSGALSIGYRIDQYMGMVDTQTRNTVTPGLPPAGNQNDDAKFNGPFVRLTVGFGMP